MHITKRTWWMSGLILLAVAGAPVALLAQEAATEAAPEAAPSADPMVLLKTIPEDATGFVALRDVAEFNKDVMAVSAKIGFPLGPEGFFPAPLDWLKSSMGIEDGLADSGGAALVLLNCAKITALDDLEGRLVIALPSNNAKALIEALGGTDEEAGVYQLDMGGEPSVATGMDGFVIVAQTAEALKEFKAKAGEGVVKAMAPDRVKAYLQQDIFAWINMQKLSPELKGAISTSVGDLFQGFQAMANPMMAANPKAEEQVNDIVVQLKQFMEQADQLSGGLRADPKVGIVLSGYSRVKPDSDMAKMLAAMKPAAEPLLYGLPNEPVILAGGASSGWSPETEKQVRDAMGRLIKQFASMDADAGSPLTEENLKPILESYIKLISSIDQLSFSVAGLPAEGDAGRIGLTAVVKVKDAKAWRAELKGVFEKAKEKAKEIAIGVAKADGAEEDKVKLVADAFVWKENAEEIGGASVDQMVVQVEQIAKALGEEMPAEDLEKMHKIIGKEGVLIRVGTLGNEHVIVTFGGGEPRFTAVAGLVEKKQSPLSKNKDFQKVAGRLPEGNRMAVVYLGLDHLLELINIIAAQVEAPMPKLVMRNAAPIAMTSILVDKTAQQIDVLIPMELVSSTATLVREAIPLFMGGGMGAPMDMQEEPAIEENEKGSDSDNK